MAHECGQLEPVRGGRAYRVDSPPENAMVTSALAAELRRVLDCFARDAGFSPRHTVSMEFRPGIVGHHQAGRAADIYGVGGADLDVWAKRWYTARHRSRANPCPICRGAMLAQEWKQNLGWRLYKALQVYGRWARPRGYPVQLFGPWTRSEGPLRSISDRLLHAHRDHIHVAK